MSQRLWLSPALSAPIAAVLYWRRENGLDTGNKHVAAILRVPESRVRRTKEVYCWDRTMRLPIAKIRRDGGTQSRASIPGERVKLYAEVLSDGNPLPPPIVFYDGENYWLADGFIRTAASQSVGMVEIEVDVRQGSQRDAQLFSFGANATHGTPRTQADVRRAIVAMLNDPEWSKWSDREIAKRVGTSQPTVSKYRNEGHCKDLSVTERTYINKHGQTATMNVASVGKTPKAVAVEPVEPAVQVGSPEPEPIAPRQPAKKIAVTVIPKEQTTAEFVVKAGMDAQLADSALPRYEAEVAFYREIQPEVVKLKARVEAALTRYGAASGGELGPFALAVTTLLRSATPDKWAPCKVCRDDALMSTGQNLIGPCNKCKGFGFLITPN